MTQSFIFGSTPPASSNDLVPLVQMRTLASKRRIRVVYVGDSNITPVPNFTITEHVALNGKLQQALVEANPDREFEFFDAAIGGSLASDFFRGTWTSLAKIYEDPATGGGGRAEPYWVADLSSITGLNASVSTWFDFVVALKPDLLVLNFGINDGDKMAATRVDALMTEIGVFLPDTAIIVVTNMLPLGTGENDAAIQDARMSRLLPQLYFRSLATHRGWGMLDLGRHACRAVLGFDPRRTRLVRSVNEQEMQIPVADLAACAQDFYLKAEVPAAMFDDTGLKITTSRAGLNAESYLLLEKVDGVMRVRAETSAVGADGAGGRSIDIKGTYNLPTSGTVTVEVTVKDVFCAVTVDGREVWARDSAGAVLHGRSALRLVRFGGIFSPKVSRIDGGTVDATVTYWTSEFIRETPFLSEREAFGQLGSEDGGNGQNHFGGAGAEAVVAPVVDAVDWRLPPVQPISGTIPPMALDSVHRIELPDFIASGVFYMTAERNDVFAMVPFLATATPRIQATPLLGAITLAVAGTAMTGTTGASGRVTVSIREGVIEVESRLNLVGFRYWIGAAT